MHSAFTFPIECSYIQKKFKEVSWVEIKYRVNDDVLNFEMPDGSIGISLTRNTEPHEDYRFLLVPPDDAEYETYDAFDEPDLIPSLVRLVEKVNRGDNKKDAVKKWVEKWGYLSLGNRYPFEFSTNLKNLSDLTKRRYGNKEHGKSSNVSVYYASLGHFWEDAVTLVRLWDMYRQITNRQLTKLQEWIVFHRGEVSSNYAFVNGIRNAKIRLENSLEEIQQNPLYFYQTVGFRHLFEYVSNQTRLSLDSKEIKFEQIKDQDFFKITPYLRTENLLEAMYVQFFILLSENTKKICTNCGKPFPPNRRDQQYCSESCSNTAKSRRYRQRKMQGVLSN
jgi:predicted nucleic acid-binding Zn ribbon protein